jgi:hypothetical protein
MRGFREEEIRVRKVEEKKKEGKRNGKRETASER